MSEEIKFLELRSKVDNDKLIKIKFTSIDVVQDELHSALIFVGPHIFEVHRTTELIRLFNLNVTR